MKKMIRLLHRRFALSRPRGYNEPTKRKPIIWNGQVGDHNCLSDYDTRFEWDKDKACPDIKDDLDQQNDDNAQTVDECQSGVGGNPVNILQLRANSGSCPYVPGGGSGGGQTISFTSGPNARPTCASGTGCGGRLCTGFWCNPSVTTQVPPDYHDPKDPNGGGSVPITTIPGPGDTTPTKPTSSTPSETSSEPPPPNPSPYYDCEGETLCSTMEVKNCDQAVNNMERGGRIYTANTGSINSEGNWWCNALGFGCSVRIRGKDRNGKDCQITGDNMWWAYQDIRQKGQCSKCGSKHFGDGCLVSIDYQYDCSDRSRRLKTDRNATLTGRADKRFDGKMFN